MMRYFLTVSTKYFGLYWEENRVTTVTSITTWYIYSFNTIQNKRHTIY